MKHVLFWGRYGNYGPDYPRNRVIESVLRGLDCRVTRFLPWLSPLADLEYVLRGGRKPDLVWVPCFRQRDLAAAARYARRNGVPLVFDPLISAYDKQVNERQKFRADEPAARRLLDWESRLFRAADILIADTQGHADYFESVHGVAPERLRVIPVGAEEALFRPEPMPGRGDGQPLQLAFFGTFIGLQGVEILAEAIRGWDGPPVHWRLIGEGPLKERCAAILDGVTHSRIDFEPWGPLAELPGRLYGADAILGIFGDSDKARRVIPNKVYQGLAIGRPVITARTGAYPSGLTADDDGGHGIFWAPPGDPAGIRDAVRRLHAVRHRLPQLGTAARQTYEAHFSNRVIAEVLRSILEAGERS